MRSEPPQKKSWPSRSDLELSIKDTKARVLFALRKTNKDWPTPKQQPKVGLRWTWKMDAYRPKGCQRRLLLPLLSSLPIHCRNLNSPPPERITCTLGACFYFLLLEFVYRWNGRRPLGSRKPQGISWAKGSWVFFWLLPYCLSDLPFPSVWILWLS